MNIIRLSITAILTATLACAASTGRSSGPSTDRLTGPQMTAVAVTSVYEAVQKLRPEWLSSRGPRSLMDDTPTVANVAIGGQVVGDIDYLRRLSPDAVKLLRYWTVGEAGARFGMNNPRGVIEVVLKGGR